MQKYINIINTVVFCTISLNSTALIAGDSVSNYVDLTYSNSNDSSSKTKIINHIDKTIIYNRTVLVKQYVINLDIRESISVLNSNYGYLDIEILNPDNGIREIISDSLGGGKYLDDQPMVCPKERKRVLFSSWKDEKGVKKEIYTCMRISCDTKLGWLSDPTRSGGYDPVDCNEKESLYQRRFDIREKYKSTGVFDVSRLTDFEKTQTSYHYNRASQWTNDWVSDKTIYGLDGDDIFYGIFKNVTIHETKGNNLFTAGEGVTIYGGSGHNTYTIGDSSWKYSPWLLSDSGFVIKDFKMSGDTVSLSSKSDGTRSLLVEAIKEGFVFPSANRDINVVDQGDGRNFKIKLGSFVFSVTTTSQTTTTDLWNKLKGENYYVDLTGYAGEFIPEEFGGYAKPFINMGTGASTAWRGGLATSFMVISGPDIKTLKNFDMERDRILLRRSTYNVNITPSSQYDRIGGIDVIEKSPGVFAVIAYTMNKNVKDLRNLEIHLKSDQDDVTAKDLEKKIWRDNGLSEEPGNAWFMHQN